MAFAITKIQAYGIEVEEPINKRCVQKVILTLTALAADVDLDLGDSASGALGVFWTAAGGSVVGAKSLTAFRDIATKAEAFDTLGGSFTLARSRGAATAATVYTVVAGAANQTPNIAFDAGAGPTAYNVVLSWTLAQGNIPTELYAQV